MKNRSSALFLASFLGVLIPYVASTYARPYVMPPKTPKERVRILRKALTDTFKDPEFLADAQKARLDLNPLSGEEMEKVVARTYGLKKPLVEKLKDILK